MNQRALERHGRLRKLYEDLAERRHNHPESQARWEALALGEDRFIEAINKDIARVGA